MLTDIELDTVYETIVSVLESIYRGEMEPTDARIPILIENGLADIGRQNAIENALQDYLLSIGHATQKSNDAFNRIEAEHMAAESTKQ